MWKNTLWRGIWPTSSVQWLNLSDSSQPHGMQHARPPCPSPTSGVYSNSSPLSWWCHPTISSSVVPFSSCLQSFPASGSFPVSQLFPSDGQSIGVSASASVLPMSTQDWFSLEWTCWISLHPRDSQESSPTPQFKSINSSALTFLYSPTLTSIHDCWKNRPISGILPRDNLWECKLVQPLWRTVWRFLKKLEIELPYDPAIPLLGIHTEENLLNVIANLSIWHFLDLGWHCTLWLLLFITSIRQHIRGAERW